MCAKSFKIIISILIVFSANPIFSQRSGNFCLFNGENSYIEVNDNNSLDFDNQVTIDAWIYLCDLDDHYMIVSKNHCAGNRLSYYFSVNGGKLIWRWSDNGVCEGGNEFSTDKNVVKRNTWTHVAVSVSSSSIEMYVNGQMVSGRLINGYYSSILATNVPLKIGVYQRINSDHGHYFPGKMDNLRIWNKKLSSTEIKNSYQNNLVGLQDNLVLFFNMDDLLGNIVKNKASNGPVNDGTIVGHPWFIDKMGFEIGSDTTTCLGNLVFLEIEHHPNASILWSTGHTSFDYSIDTEGSYWAKYSLGKCDLYDTIKVEFKDLISDLIKDTVICDNEVVTIKVPQEYKNFEWFDNSKQSQKDIYSAGNYWIKNYDGNCSVVDYFNIDSKLKPLINLGEDINVCSDEVVIINVESNTGHFTWNDGIIDSRRVIKSSGRYWVKSENECGSSIDSISVYIQPKINPDYLKDTVVCGNQIVLQVPQHYKPSYVWFDNSYNEYKQISSPGIYWIEFQDNNCTVKDYTNISFAEIPFIDLGEDKVIKCKDEVLEIVIDPTINGRILWSDSTNEMNKAIKHAGVYTISIENNCGIVRDTLHVDLKKLGKVFVPNVITVNQDKYNQKFVIDEKFTDATVQLYNRYGRLVWKSEHYENDFSGDNLSSGMYYYLLKDDCTKEEFKGWLHIIK